METKSTQDYLNTGNETRYTPTNDERTMAILAHILTIAVSVFAPLIIYLIKKDESKFVAQHAKESLNFQLTAILASIVLAITVIGLFFVWLIWIAVFVFVIIATIKASENKSYRYPLSIRFIK